MYENRKWNFKNFIEMGRKLKILLIWVIFLQNKETYQNTLIWYCICYMHDISIFGHFWPARMVGGRVVSYGDC